METERHPLIVAVLAVVSMAPFVGVVLGMSGFRGSETMRQAVGFLFLIGWLPGGMALGVHASSREVDGLHWLAIPIGFFIPLLSPLAYPTYWFLAVFTPWYRQRSIQKADEEVHEDLW